jgi:hypothetical protein
MLWGKGELLYFGEMRPFHGEEDFKYSDSNYITMLPSLQFEMACNRTTPQYSTA